MLFKEIVDAGHCAFFESASDWRDAVRKSCRQLVRTGYAARDYEERIIECVEEFGPYIVIIPGLAIPHSTKGSPGVTRTAIAFTKFEKPVQFDPDDREKDATLFFTLAAADDEKHLENMRQLFTILSDEQILQRLLQVKSEQDLLALDKDICQALSV